MKGKVKLYKNDGQTDGLYPVKLILSHNRKTRRKTIHHSHVLDWDELHNLPKPSHPDYEDLYERISGIQRKVQTREFKELEDFDNAFSVLIREEEKESDADFYAFAEKQIQNMKRLQRYGNAEAYEVTIEQIRKHHRKLSFSDLTPEVLNDFKKAKKEDGNKNVSIRKYLNELRAIYNSAPEAYTEGRNPFRNIYKDLPIQKRRARNRYLSKEQIKFLEETDFIHKSYQRTIDLSLLQYYLCGCDLTDIYYLKWNDIENGRVFLSRNKLGTKAYEFDVLLLDQAKRIIDKYSEPGGEYIFPWNKSYMGYKTFRNNHNRTLKLLQKRYEISLLPKNDNFTTKVMRHTFATHGKFARIEEDLLRELMGHERNDIDTAYKDKYPEAERDAAQRRIMG